MKPRGSLVKSPCKANMNSNHDALELFCSIATLLCGLKNLKYFLNEENNFVCKSILLIIFIATISEKKIKDVEENMVQYILLQPTVIFISHRLRSLLSRGMATLRALRLLFRESFILQIFVLMGAV